MPSTKLTDTKVRNLKYDPDGPRNQRLWDTEVSGLGVEVYATGKKKYLFAYRYAKKQKFLVMGHTTDLSLDDARDEATEHRKTLRDGYDPKNPPVTDPAVAGQSMTLSQLFEKYDAELFDTFTKDTASNLRSTFNKYLKDPLGERAIGSITTPEIKAIHKQIVSEGREGAARGLQVRAKMIFSYAIEEGLIDRNPAIFKTRYKSSGKREDWLETDDELRKAWFVDVKPVVRGLVRLLMLTGARRDEMRTLKWSDIDNGVLRVSDTKTDKPLVLPITPSMERVLAEMYSMHGDKSEYVFPATTSYRKPIPQGSLHHLLMTHADGWSCHVLRHTVKSHLAELKIPLESRAAILNHALPGIGEGVYNHSEMMEFKRDGLEKWHDKLEKIMTPTLKIANNG